MKVAARNAVHLRIHTVFCTLLFVFFCGLVFNEIRFAPFLYDSAIHIEVSDVLAHDIGSFITPYKNELFIAQTTGPTLTLPGAVIVRLLGSSIEVAGISAALVNLFCLCWLIFSLHRLLGTQTTSLVTLAFIVIFVLQDLQWWVWMIGDNAAFLLFLVSATIASHNTTTHKTFIGLAIASALSLQARLTSIPLLAGCWIFLLAGEISRICRKQQTHRQLAISLLIGTATLVLALLPYKILEYWFYHGQDAITYEDFIAGRFEFLSKNSAVGIGNLLTQENILTHIYNNIVNNHALLGRQLHEKYGLAEQLAWLLPTATILLSLPALLHRKNSIDDLVTCLFSAYLLLLIWFFMLATLIYSRYTFQIINLSFIILCLSLLRSNTIIPLAIFLASLCIATQLYRQPSLLEELPLPSINTQKALQDQKYNQLTLEAGEFLEQHPPRYPLAKYGWVSTSRALNYLLPGTDNFNDAVMMIHSALKKKNNSGYEWNREVNFTLVIENASWRFVKTNPENRKVQNALLSACRQGLIFENAVYRIMECTFDNIKKSISVDSENAFTSGTPY